MTDRRLRPYGDAAVLVDVADDDAALAWYAELRERPPAGAVDVVPAERSVLVRVDLAATSLAELAADLGARVVDPGPAADGPLVTIPVVYDGADLGDAATAAGWTVDQLVAAHQGRTWRVAFVGFSPGFGYLVADGDWPDLPRRADPRTRVPAGAVGVAGRYSGVYPSASPGGWQLVGRTDLVLWDPYREPPAPLTPGTRVRFEAAG